MSIICYTAFVTFAPPRHAVFRAGGDRGRYGGGGGGYKNDDRRGSGGRDDWRGGAQGGRYGGDSYGGGDRDRYGGELRRTSAVTLVTFGGCSHCFLA